MGRFLVVRSALAAMALSFGCMDGIGHGARAQSGLDGLIADKKACLEALEINKRESAARQAQLRQIADDDYAGLCRYGRTVGQPGLDRGVARLKNTPGCRATDDMYMKAVVDAQFTLAKNNRQAVARDCKKAGL